MLLTRCRSEKAKLVLVEFWTTYGWRRQGPLAERLDENSDLCTHLDPVPLTSAEGHLDPVRRFRAWREVERTQAMGKDERKLMLTQAIAARQEGQEHLSLKELARALNADGFSTPTGKPWTAENLPKYLERL